MRVVVPVEIKLFSSACLCTEIRPWQNILLFLICANWLAISVHFQDSSRAVTLFSLLLLFPPYLHLLFLLLFFFIFFTISIYFPFIYFLHLNHFGFFFSSLGQESLLFEDHVFQDDDR